MQTHTLELDTLIEEQRWNAFTSKLMFWCALTMLVEGYEMQMVGYAAPAMIKALHVGKASFGSIFGAGNFGYLLGALLLSSLGDKLGRRRLILIGAVIFSMFTLSAAYAHTLVQLCSLRFLAGIGLGGAVPNAIALTVEYSPRKSRATRVSFLYVAYTLGGAAAGMLAANLMPGHGWQIVFSTGGWLGLITCVLLLLFLPESVRFLAQNRSENSTTLRSILSRLAPDVTITPETKILVEEKRANRVPVLALFQEGRQVMTILLWIAYICGIMALQFMTSWLPTLINSAGIGISMAVFVSSMFHVGGTVGNVAVGWLNDRKGIYAIAISFLLAVPVLILLGPATATLPLLVIAVLLAGFFIVGSQNGINGVAGTIYPTWMRSTGAGWATGIGRMGSVLGPMLGGYLMNFGLSPRTLFLCVCAPAIVAAICMAGIARGIKHSPQAIKTMESANA